jgi:hypothetical protein
LHNTKVCKHNFIKDGFPFYLLLIFGREISWNSSTWHIIIQLKNAHITIYLLHWFVWNSHEIYYFMSSYFLHMNFVCLKHVHDACISRMKYFQPFENISSYLYMHRTCFKLMISMCKKHKLMEKMISSQFPLSNHGMESLWCISIFHIIY